VAGAAVAGIAAGCGSDDNKLVNSEASFCSAHPAVDGGPPPEITTDEQKQVWTNWCAADAGAK
jgi:hypothetical protein